MQNCAKLVKLETCCEKHVCLQKFGFDTAENEPTKNLINFAKNRAMAASSTSLAQALFFAGLAREGGGQREGAVWIARRGADPYFGRPVLGRLEADFCK